MSTMTNGATITVIATGKSYHSRVRQSIHGQR